MEQTILLKNAAGQPLTGLPNPTANALGTSADGLGSEGLVLAANGTFWISDEYGPHIAHFDATGKQLERINPFGSGQGGRTLPLVLARRRPNRGMEGLTITPDGKTLVGLTQSPMYNPSSAAVSGSVVLRVVAFDLATATTKQYAYLLDNASLSGCSEIAAITNTTFLGLKRDGLYGGNATTPATFRRVYKLDLAGATDLSAAANSAAGKLYGGLTVEQLKDQAGLTAAGVVPVTKTLVFDLPKDISPVYPPDKAEGLALIGNDRRAISNNDDFGVVDNGSNGFTSKILPATGKVDVNRIYFVKLPTPLR